MLIDASLSNPGLVVAIALASLLAVFLALHAYAQGTIRKIDKQPGASVSAPSGRADELADQMRREQRGDIR